MSTSYVKLYGSILNSTIWMESSDTKVVWITLLAMADADGIARTSTPGLARTAGVNLEACRSALAILESPDSESGTPDHDGRRILKVDGGFLILNHGKYRDTKTPKQQKWAEDKRRQRARHAAECPPCPVDKVDMSTMSTTYTDTDTDTDTNTKKEGGDGFAEPLPPVFDEVRAEWNAMAKAARLPECRSLTKSRKAALKARLADPDWRDNWRAAVATIPKTPFLLGQNKRRWQITFDFFLKPDTVTKILEGGYANGKFTYSEECENDNAGILR